MEYDFCQQKVKSSRMNEFEWKLGRHHPLKFREGRLQRIQLIVNSVYFYYPYMLPPKGHTYYMPNSRKG